MEEFFNTEKIKLKYSLRAQNSAFLFNFLASVVCHTTLPSIVLEDPVAGEPDRDVVGALCGRNYGLMTYVTPQKPPEWGFMFFWRNY